MAKEMTISDISERVRQAVIRRGGTVTIGDIVTETGLGTFEAKQGLTELMKTHEGIMRVSEKGELLYAFSRGCIRRDYRSWWTRNKELILKMIKLMFKVIIMLTLVVYFIIYLLILVALLSSNRDDDSGGDVFVWGIYFFWGWGDAPTDGRYKKRVPLYTRVYNFVFGPEQEKLDPLEAKTKCAQLIRARKGIISVEDWMMVSGQTREKCESDLAQFTAEFEGEAEITEQGTLIYVFEDMMKSGERRFSHMPALSWNSIQGPRALSGNETGNGIVIGLNTFNLVMSSFIWHLFYSAELDARDAAMMQGIDPDTLVTGYGDIINWLGVFPCIFSILIFAGPLVRLPFNIKENNKRRQEAIRRAVLSKIFAHGKPVQRLNRLQILPDVNEVLENNDFRDANDADVKYALADLSDELGGEMMTDEVEPVYDFDELVHRSYEVEDLRDERRLDHQSVGRVVFSTDNEEQEACEDAEDAARLDDFDRALRDSARYDHAYENEDDRKNHSRSAY